MNPPRVVVIGAGAAGLTAALRAAEAGSPVTLLNAHPKIGLKILMSGGTRCNVTHREVTERDYSGGSRPFVARILRAFPASKAREWLESLGVELKLEETGKYFPVTDDANTMLEALLRAVRRGGVDVQSGTRVVRLERREGAPAGARFRLGIQTVEAASAFDTGLVSAHGEGRWPLPQEAPDRWLEARAVVLATGGLSFPRTGSDGVGYSLVTALGHTMEPPVPALTPLTSSDDLCRELQGLTLDTELTLWVDGRHAIAITGSFLVAHFGYSGPAALDLSRHWLRAEGERKVTVSFLPGVTRESVASTLQKDAATGAGRTVRRSLARLLPERLAQRLCTEAGIEGDLSASQLDRGRRAELLERILARDLGVTGTLGYEKAEVTAGGAKLSEVNSTTLESRIVPGLFLCGEILDVDGRLGGFNFQWAWSSGTVAGRATANEQQGSERRHDA